MLGVISDNNHNELTSRTASWLSDHFSFSDKDKSLLSILLCGGRSLPLIVKSLQLSNLLERSSLFLTDERLPLNGDSNNSPGILNALGKDYSFRFKPIVDDGSPMEFSNYGSIYSMEKSAGRLAFISVGEDGHVSSIFPHMESRKQGREFELITVDDSPKPPSRRVSFSLATFLAQDLNVLLFMGPSKKDALNLFLRDKCGYPLNQLYSQGKCLVVTDNDEEVKQWKFQQ
jgi:6-phosphogluconolactonase/glucosamine-6-phosphate isomerase/deaminase